MKMMPLRSAKEIGLISSISEIMSKRATMTHFMPMMHNDKGLRESRPWADEYEVITPTALGEVAMRVE